MAALPIEDPPCMAAPAALTDAIAPLILTYLSDDRDLITARAINTCWQTVVDLEGPRHSPFLRRLQLVQKKLPSVRGRMFTVEVIGSFQSGKSTLFRQLSWLMGCGDSIAALMPTKTHVWATMFDAISALVDGCDQLNLEIRDEAALMAFEAVSMQGDPDIDMTSGRFLWRLWKDAGVRSCWDRWEADPRGLREVAPQIDANTPALMDRCRDIFAESHTNDAEPAPALDVSTALLGYVNVGDRPPYARLRWPRNLPVEAALHVELTEHGLRPATVLRRDFSNPDAVCFVAALSDYDCPPQLGRGSRTRLLEALELFEESCAHMRQEGLAAPVIVVLNKVDLFTRWIAQPGRGLDTVWPEYTGGADADAAIAFVRHRFVDAHERACPAAQSPRVVCCTALDLNSVADDLWPELVATLCDGSSAGAPPWPDGATTRPLAREPSGIGNGARAPFARGRSGLSSWMPRRPSRPSRAAASAGGGSRGAAPVGLAGGASPRASSSASLMGSVRAAMNRMGM